MDRAPAEVWGIPPSARSWAVETWRVCSFTCDTGDADAVEALTRGWEDPQSFLVALGRKFSEKQRGGDGGAA